MPLYELTSTVKGNMVKHIRFFGSGQNLKICLFPHIKWQTEPPILAYPDYATPSLETEKAALICHH